MGLYRRKQKSSVRDVVSAVSNELEGSASCIGYRLMLQRLRIDHHLIVDRETVRLALKVIDPDGEEMRKKRRLKRRKYSCPGPNYLWHIDGYDKLKPYGFAIHGCIDGYSRRIMWLEVTSTNKDAAVIADHFLQCVQQMKGTARIVRADPGTENVKVEVLQKFYRANGRDSFSGEKSFMYGKSTANQRIEAWWAFLRNSDMDWWITFFKDLRDSAQFKDYDAVHVECLRFCFMGVIQAELDRIAKHWNLHRIRPQNNVESPPGRPDTLFFLPELKDTTSYMHPVSEDDLRAGKLCCSSRRGDLVCLPEFADVAVELMAKHKLDHAQTPTQAKQLFSVLIRLLENLL